MLSIDPHPLLDLYAFSTSFADSLGQLTTPQTILDLLALEAAAPMQSSDEVRLAVRDLLRHGGFKPTGRSKPASEYLIKASSGGFLSTINLAVDACNAISLHSGLPISVVDLDLVQPPLHIGIAEKQSSYVFNAAGQTIDIGGLVCLSDTQGPCACAVKDSQRMKTRPETRKTLSVVWGTHQLLGRAAETGRWYRDLLNAAGAQTEPVPSENR